MTAYTPHCYDDGGDRLHDPQCLLPDGECRDRADALRIGDAADRDPDGTASGSDLTTVRAAADRATARFRAAIDAYGYGIIGRATYRAEVDRYNVAQNALSDAVRAAVTPVGVAYAARIDAALGHADDGSCHDHCWQAAVDELEAARRTGDPWAGGALAARLRAAQDRLVSR